MATFTVFDPASSSLSTLLNALLASNSGIVFDPGSIVLHASGLGAVNLYDASVGAPLGLGAGVLLTSGTTPGTSNTLSWFGSDNSGSSGFDNGDADINAVVNTVFQTQSYDATTLAFNFTVSDPKAVSLSFDLVFGSDEYPEWVDAFVDCGVVIVDGVNYALFNKDPLAPLSVISPNLAAGYFQDNGGNTIPIEYDGVSGHLRIVAPLNPALSTHTIKIGIADTGDHILDSGLFISNLSAGTDPGSGVVSDPGGGSSGNDSCTGTGKDEYFNLLAGDDTVYAAGGADIVVAGSGNDQVFAGSGNDDVKGEAGDDLLDGGADVDTAVYSGASGAYAISFDASTGKYSINGTEQGEGVDTLVGIEQLKFSDGLFTLSESAGVVSLTAVTAPPPPAANTPGVLVITGLAAVGYTLSAHLSDVDGLPDAAAVSWQWVADGVAIEGATSSSYLLQMADVNAQIWVEATYSDAKSNGEQLSSNSVFVPPLPSDGDLTVSLMAIDGPVGAGVNTTITTLLERAVELGATPNVAVQQIRSALKIPASVGNLLSTNAFQILQNSQSSTAEKASALALAKLEVQVAVLCSLSGDPQGSKLTLALLDKAAAGGSFDLSKAADVAAILGLDTSTFDLAVKSTYPQPLKEIVDRNSNIRDASQLFIPVTGTGSSIEAEWKDFLSNWDALSDTVPLSSLSVAINLAPSGSANAVLPDLAAGEAYALSLAQLTSGFHDPDGDPLVVTDLTTDHGAWFTLAADGSWVLDPGAADYDPSYVGPLELSYRVDDGQGHSVFASQLLVVVDHANHAPDGLVTLSVVGSGALQQGATLQATDNLSDPDGITGSVTYSWYAGNNPFGQGSSVVLGQDQVGQAIHVEASYVDGYGTHETISSDTTSLVANVDDAPTGGVTINAGSPPKLGDTVSATNDIADLDGIPTSGSGALTIRWQSSADGLSWSDIAAATGTSLVIGSALVGLKLRAQARYTDNWGTATSVSSLPSAAVVGVGIVWTGTSSGDVKSGTAWDDTLNGAAGADKLSGLAGANLLDGGAGNDTLIGGTGNDSYGVDSASDLITELAAEGNDTAIASVTYSLLSKGANVETLVLSGTAAINGTGNALANTLTGNSGANLLQGSTGNDTLSGAAGNDTLAGGKGTDQLTGGLNADVFRFDTAPEKINGVAVVDTITDYSTSQGDRLELSSLAFTALSGSAVSGGLLTAGAFLASSSGTATTASQRILYNTTTGVLSYDSDGSGSTAAQAFAKLSPGLALTAGQILVSSLPLGV